MVIDEVGSERFPRYLVYDIVKFEGIDVGMTEFSTRLVCIEREIVGARNTYIKTVKNYSKNAFQVYMYDIDNNSTFHSQGCPFSYLIIVNNYGV